MTDGAKLGPIWADEDIPAIEEALADGAYAWIHDPVAVEKFNAELKNYLTPKRILELSQPLERIDEHED